MKNEDVIRKQMAKAEELIKKKKFDDARSILITIDDPTAEKWLERLNAMAPNSQTVVVQEKKRGGCLRTIGGAVVVLFIFIIVLAMIPQDGTTPSNSSSNEAGSSRTNPHPTGSAYAIRDGRFQVNSLERNATARVHEMNMFNSEPEAGQEWVLVDATFFCDLNADAVCNTNVMQFELVGSAGKAYNHQLMAVIEPKFGAEVFGGGSTNGLVGFIVDSSDSNFVFIVVDRGRTFFAIP